MDWMRVHAAGDVGLARIMDATHLATGLAPCGTFAYAAPEMLMGTRCSEKVRCHHSAPAGVKFCGRMRCLRLCSSMHPSDRHVCTTCTLLSAS